MKKIIFALLFLATAHLNFAQNKINQEESEISFSVTNMEVNVVEGYFEGLQGDVTFDPNDPESASFDMKLDPEDIDTGNGLRDKHLRNKKNWFYTKLFPEIKFKSTEVVESDDGREYKVIGDLTIKETTKEIEIPFKFSEKDDGSVHLLGTFELSRLDYEVGGEGTTLVGEDVAVKIKCVLE